MPNTHNGDIRLYYETVGQGPPLLLQQGFATATDCWRITGYLDALKDRYTLILMDQRGVGRSSRPTDPKAYATELRVRDMTAVLDACGVETAHYFGYSQGAMRGWHALGHTPERFRSMILGAGRPSFGGIDGLPNPMGDSMRQITQDDWIADLAQGFSDRWSPAIEQVYRDQSLEALAADRSFHHDPELTPDMLSVPVLCYAGDNDQPSHDVTRAFCDKTPMARFVSLEGMDHVEGFFALDRIVPQIDAFINEIEAGLAKEAST